MAVKQVLVGFYDIPKSVEQPLQLVINPEVQRASPHACRRSSALCQWHIAQHECLPGRISVALGCVCWDI